MKIVLVTGSTGLIGSESVRFFAKKGFKVVGLDNNMRRDFFGDEASTNWNKINLQREIEHYTHYEEDIRNEAVIENIFRKYGADIKLIVHTAAQPSHDWAARNPKVDFGVNAMGSLILLEMTRKYSPGAVFIFTSTNYRN